MGKALLTRSCSTPTRPRPVSASLTSSRPKRSGPSASTGGARSARLVDDAVATFEASENAALLDNNFQSAFRLMTSPQARDAFDLSRESDTTRDRYGRTRFG